MNRALEKCAPGRGGAINICTLQTTLCIGKNTRKMELDCMQQSPHPRGDHRSFTCPSSVRARVPLLSGSGIILCDLGVTLRVQGTQQYIFGGVDKDWHMATVPGQALGSNPIKSVQDYVLNVSDGLPVHTHLPAPPAHPSCYGMYANMVHWTTIHFIHCHKC